MELSFSPRGRERTKLTPQFITFLIKKRNKKKGGEGRRKKKHDDMDDRLK